MEITSELIGLLGLIFAVGVPSLALAAHLVLRPMIRDLAQALGKGKEVPDAELTGRLARIEERLDRIGELTERLAEAERFRRELEAGRRVREIEATTRGKDSPVAREP